VCFFILFCFRHTWKSSAALSRRASAPIAT
jgi:hypothetical protein